MGNEKVTALTSRHCYLMALRLFERYTALYPLAHYTGILSLHGLARLAMRTKRGDLIERIRSLLLPFVEGRHRHLQCNFLNYRIGGNATAFLLMEGYLPEAEEGVRQYADQILFEASRTSDGILCSPRQPELVWIDAAFAVTPFLLFAGRALNQPVYIEEAYQQTAKLITVLRDPENGLLHQARGFQQPGRTTEDHWSRGNGWALLALTELCAYLPIGHHRRPEAERLYRDLLGACLRVRGPSGLWHQELLCHDSYVETSGSGLILYALGVGLEIGLWPSELRQVFRDGLMALLNYVTPAGDVFHACRGCLAPGEGRMIDYMVCPPVRNDPHGFGPLILAFAEGVKPRRPGRSQPTKLTSPMMLEGVSPLSQERARTARKGAENRNE